MKRPLPSLFVSGDGVKRIVLEDRMSFYILACHSRDYVPYESLARKPAFFLFAQRLKNALLFL